MIQKKKWKPHLQSWWNINMQMRASQSDVHKKQRITIIHLKGISASCLSRNLSMGTSSTGQKEGKTEREREIKHRHPFVIIRCYTEIPKTKKTINSNFLHTTNFRRSFYSLCFSRIPMVGSERMPLPSIDSKWGNLLLRAWRFWSWGKCSWGSWLQSMTPAKKKKQASESNIFGQGRSRNKQYQKYLAAHARAAARIAREIPTPPFTSTPR